MSHEREYPDDLPDDLLDAALEEWEPPEMTGEPLIGELTDVRVMERIEAVAGPLRAEITRLRAENERLLSALKKACMTSKGYPRAGTEYIDGLQILQEAEDARIRAARTQEAKNDG